MFSNSALYYESEWPAELEIQKVSDSEKNIINSGSSCFATSPRAPCQDVSWVKTK